MSGKEELNEYVSILNADCLEYMRTVADNTFDLAVVDPDFGLNEKISKVVHGRQSIKALMAR